ncbi:PREDICTED: baculoviral IAP repeat-containing protein 3-like [Vollenhovia emeryi]|uniref:baculoviral IAP repeat-containing protein 3-like n=1 Tax=Vollenhovia emeryi TaxID=411798 RepID=UPI0005F540CE|nr:PREDICTED: baculoviral IAP repeat-containing protein 3-like [Vollenhovia emeryi]
MWEKIVSLAPGLSENLKFIMSDYEKAAITVMNEQFPVASIHGCWFHYSQALYRKWQRLQLKSAPRELLSMAMSMALAPSSLFMDSLNIMQIVADRISVTYPNVLLFMAYLRSTWLPIASKVSVHNCPVRTNNLVESFHHIANQKIGTKPNLWVFLEHLSEIISNQEIDYSRLRNNIRVRRARTRFNKEKNIQIKEGQNALMNGDISLEHFLRMFSRFNEHYQQPELLLEANDNEEIDASLLSDRIPESAESRYPQNFRQRRRRSRNNVLTIRQEGVSPSIESSDVPSEEQHLNVNQNSAGEQSTNDHMIENRTNDEEIYRIPEDDYSFFDESLTSPETTFYKICDVQKLIDDNKEPQPAGSCIICLSKKALYVFVPCGHLCVCDSCSNNIMHKRCPMCNLPYDNCIKTISS